MTSILDDDIFRPFAINPEDREIKSENIDDENMLKKPSEGDKIVSEQVLISIEELDALRKENALLKNKIQKMMKPDDILFTSALCSINYHYMSSSSRRHIEQYMYGSASLAGVDLNEIWGVGANEKVKRELDEGEYSSNSEEENEEFKHTKRKNKRKGLITYYMCFVEDRIGNPNLLRGRLLEDEEWDIPSYERLIEHPLSLPEVDMSKPSSAYCWNCGDEEHGFRDCPYPRNQGKIAAARRQFSSVKPTRYHLLTKADKLALEISSLKPGVISDRLREALGIKPNENPPYYEKMAVYGYPPSYFGVQGTSLDSENIGIFDENNNNTNNNNNNPNNSTEKKPLVNYPGLEELIAEMKKKRSSQYQNHSSNSNYNNSDSSNKRDYNRMYDSHSKDDRSHSTHSRSERYERENGREFDRYRYDKERDSGDHRDHRGDKDKNDRYDHPNNTSKHSPSSSHRHDKKLKDTKAFNDDRSSKRQKSNSPSIVTPPTTKTTTQTQSSPITPLHSEVIIIDDDTTTTDNLNETPNNDNNHSNNNNNTNNEITSKANHINGDTTLEDNNNTSTPMSNKFKRSRSLNPIISTPKHEPFSSKDAGEPTVPSDRWVLMQNLLQEFREKKGKQG